MLRVKSVRTIGFVGDNEQIVRALTCPLAGMNKPDCFYYKSALYRVEAVDDASVRVVVFSAVDLFCNMADLLEMCDCQKSVVYITDCAKASRAGYRIDKKRLGYMLDCPVVFDKGKTVRGLNKLLSCVHIVSDTPTFCSAYQNPTLAVRSVIRLKLGILYKIKLMLKKYI